jgi:hypothetical protein
MPNVQFARWTFSRVLPALHNASVAVEAGGAGRTDIHNGYSSRLVGAKLLFNLSAGFRARFNRVRLPSGPKSHKLPVA